MIVAKGFEAAFCTSWEEWDQYDTTSFGFSNAILKPEFQAMLRVTKIDRLDIDLEKMEAQFIRYNGESEAVIAKAELELVAVSVKVENK